PGIEVYISTVSDFSVRAGYMIDGLLETMRTEVLAMRLGGIENTIVFNLNQNDVAEASEKAGSALGTILPMLLTVFLFAGAMQVGMDIIAGEKERGTLSTVLLTPVKRRDIALGKMFSLSIISLASCISSLIGVILSLPFSNSVFGGGFRISDLDYGVPELLSLILQMIFLAISFVSIICLMSSLARNIKEAGGFIAPTYMAIMVISISTILGIPEGNWVYLVPMYGNIISIKSILTLQYDAMNGLPAVASTFLFALIMAMLMVRTFNSERMMKSA
ncbi:MAG TPA: ABC transporter permease subunit, partial [Clostridia bacterium]|nr:ABC transporter permease subunit [Clostridia bacterium]